MVHVHQHIFIIYLVVYEDLHCIFIFINEVIFLQGKKYARPDHPRPDPEVLKDVGQPPIKPNYEVEKFPQEFNLEPPKGKIYDKKPFKMELEAGKRYSWCTCGKSKNQVRIQL